VARKRLELQGAVDNLRFEVKAGQLLQITISIGAAIFPHDGDSYETLLATADSRMYRDKTRRKRGTPVRMPLTNCTGGARLGSKRVRCRLASATACSTQMRIRLGRWLTVGPARCAAEPSRANVARCDRECLSALVDRYLDALVAHDPSRLSLAPVVKFTENGQWLDRRRLWHTVTGKEPYRLDIADVEAGQAVLMAQSASSPAFHYVTRRRSTIRRGRSRAASRLPLRSSTTPQGTPGTSPCATGGAWPPARVCRGPGRSPKRSKSTRG
jgi:hypothetical protein